MTQWIDKKTTETRWHHLNVNIGLLHTSIDFVFLLSFRCLTLTIFLFYRKFRWIDNFPVIYSDCSDRDDRADGCESVICVMPDDQVSCSWRWRACDSKSGIAVWSVIDQCTHTHTHTHTHRPLLQLLTLPAGDTHVILVSVTSTHKLNHRELSRGC